MADIHEMANANGDGADQYFESPKIANNLEANLETIKKEPIEREFKENKEDFTSEDQLEQNINTLAQQLIHSAKKSKLSKLFDKHFITVEGISVQSSPSKNDAMITEHDEAENRSKTELSTHSVVKSEYTYEHIKSGSKVLKPRKLFLQGTSSSSDNTNIIIDNKQIKSENESNQIQKNQNDNSTISFNCFKTPMKPQMIKVLSSPNGIQIIDTKEIGHSGVKVLEKRLHTVPKPFNFESRQSCAVKSQHTVAQQLWIFKARSATVLKKKPFVLKHEKKYTIPQNIRLSTERRAQEWRHFEQEIKEKQLYYEEILRKKKEEDKKTEMSLIKKMRQQTIHKPEPIKKYKPIIIKKSEKPVTVPLSPKFSTRLNKNCLNSKRN